MRAISATSVIALAIGGPQAAQAHHSFSEYNTQYTIQIEGEITQVRWRNPHVTMTLAVTESGGDVRTWTLETESPGMLRRMSVDDDVIKVGDHVRVAGSPAFGGRFAMYAQHFLLPSGEELLVRGAPLFSERIVGRPESWSTIEGSTANPDAGLFRVWSTTMASQLALMPPEGASGPVDIATMLTPEALDAMARFDPITAGREAGCTHKGMPRIMQQPDDMAFVQDGEDILLQIEEYDTVRRIDMTPDGDRADKPLSTLGYSSGVWENRTLIVTTTNIAIPDYPHPLPQSPQIEVVERFTPTEDGSALAYEQTVTDPAYLLQPFRFSKFWIALEGTAIDPYACAE